MLMDHLLLAGAGLLAGVINALAGGGTFFSFPVFLSLGLPPIVANASNAAAVLPAHPLAAWSARQHLSGYPRLWHLIWISLIGAVLGALALGHVGNQQFKIAIPYLLGIATLLFAYGQRLQVWLLGRREHQVLGVLGLIIMGSIAAYGGFFSAGMGVMLMAGLLLIGVHDLAVNNAIKNLLGGLVNLVAVLIWAWQGLVDWSVVPIAFVGATLGGLLGAKLSQHLSVSVLRRMVIGVGSGLTLFYADQNMQ
jgi:uncharacterized protein